MGEKMTLLPCPFCGHAGPFDQWPCEWLDATETNVIRCPMCHGAAPAARWNKRTHAPALADMAKRMEAAERDAGRYRWLRPRLAGEELHSARAAMMAIGIAGPIGARSPDFDFADELDAAIDAAQEGEG